MQWRDSVYTDCNNTVCNRSVSEREWRPEKYMFVLDSGEVGLTRREAIPVCVFTRWTLSLQRNCFPDAASTVHVTRTVKTPFQTPGRGERLFDAERGALDE